MLVAVASQIAKFMGPTWGPSGCCRPLVGPKSAHEPCYQGYLSQPTALLPVHQKLTIDIAPDIVLGTLFPLFPVVRLSFSIDCTSTYKHCQRRIVHTETAIDKYMKTKRIPLHLSIDSLHKPRWLFIFRHVWELKKNKGIPWSKSSPRRMYYYIVTYCQ